MKVQELVSPEDVKLNIQYHDTLNPALWKGKQLRPEVKDKLTEIAYLFTEYLEIPEEAILDWTISGSNANYNWTALSDIDLHLIVNYRELEEVCPGYIEEYLQDKRKLWNDRHRITINKHEVELYPQPHDDNHVSGGVYSVMYNKWLSIPTYDPPSIDDRAVQDKAARYMNEIDELLTSGCNDPEVVKKLLDRLKKMRQAGLDKAGEFSVENLAFKTLRSNGYIEKAFDCYQRSIDSQYSL